MTTASEAGITEMMIDGVDLALPSVFECHNTLAHTLSPSAARPHLDALYLGDGLPNVSDRWEWVLDYSVDENNSTLNAQIETLRTRGGVRLFLDWKAHRYTWTARAGQTFFYLPRQDAFSRAYADHTTQATYGARIWVNDVERATAKIVYKASVVAGDTVVSDEVWISNAVVDHPTAGITVAAFKFGTALALYDDVRVEFYPVYPVVVLNVPASSQTGELVGREDKAITLVEVARQ